MNPPKKSEHKQAVQTSQRALQGVRNIQEAIAGLALTTKLTKLQKIALIATVAGGTGTSAVAAYSFWPSIEIQALTGDLTADPIEAKFQFRNAGRLNLEGAVISCRINHGVGRTINTTGVLLVEPTGKRGQVLGRLGAGAPPVLRTYGGPGIRNASTHPATISIDVTWHSFKIGHQYFISQQTADGRCCLMVPESDPLPRGN
jgi:hypothetical protein